jgi:hypothetical protein
MIICSCTWCNLSMADSPLQTNPHDSTIKLTASYWSWLLPIWKIPSVCSQFEESHCPGNANLTPFRCCGYLCFVAVESPWFFEVSAFQACAFASMVQNGLRIYIFAVSLFSMVCGILGNLCSISVYFPGDFNHQTNRKLGIKRQSDMQTTRVLWNHEIATVTFFILLQRQSLESAWS